jgi:MobA-like NTP transferase domain
MSATSCCRHHRGPVAPIALFGACQIHCRHRPRFVILGSGFDVKVVILAGGLGRRLSEETASRPKPMVEIGERPILWHIMKSYSHYGFNDFVVCLGYKGYVIKEYFSNYFLHMSDVTFDMSDNSMQVHQNAAEPWRVTLVDTGAETQTGGRIRRGPLNVMGTVNVLEGNRARRTALRDSSVCLRG